MSVVGAHSVSREWDGLILVGFPGQRVVQALSHPWPVGTTQSLGRALGDQLQSYPPGSTSLICRATLCLSCVAPARRTARPVTLAGVMEWCAGAAIITAREATSVDALSRSVVGPHLRRCPFVREPCSLCLRRKIRGAGVVEPAWGPVLTGTPVRRGGNLGAHGPGRLGWF